MTTNNLLRFQWNEDADSGSRIGEGEPAEGQRTHQAVQAAGKTKGRASDDLDDVCRVEAPRRILRTGTLA